MIKFWMILIYYKFIKNIINYIQILRKKKKLKVEKKRKKKRSAKKKINLIVYLDVLLRYQKLVFYHYFCHPFIRYHYWNSHSHLFLTHPLLPLPLLILLLSFLYPHY